MAKEVHEYLLEVEEELAVQSLLMRNLERLQLQRSIPPRKKKGEDQEERNQSLSQSQRARNRIQQMNRRKLMQQLQPRKQRIRQLQPKRRLKL